jgi:hypothetical protein
LLFGPDTKNKDTKNKGAKKKGAPGRRALEVSGAVRV